jgi:hypothetical protein
MESLLSNSITCTRCEWIPIGMACIDCIDEYYTSVSIMLSLIARAMKLIHHVRVPGLHGCDTTLRKGTQRGCVLRAMND